MNDISKKIKELREARNLSQKKLAELAKVSQPTIYNIEHGKTDNVTLTVGKNIARALDISFGELFEIEGSGSGKVELKKELNELEIKNRDLIKQIEDKDLLIEMFKNEKSRIKKDVLDDKEENYDMLVNYLLEKSTYSKIQKEDIKHNIQIAMGTSYLTTTGLITQKELDERIPKYAGIVRASSPDIDI